MGPEAKIMAAVVRWAKDCGVESIRLAARTGVSQGWPDRLFLIRGGRPLFIEFKAPGKEPTVLQRRRIEQLENVGYNVTVQDSIHGACTAIASAVAAAQVPSPRC